MYCDQRDNLGQMRRRFVDFQDREVLAVHPAAAPPAGPGSLINQSTRRRLARPDAMSTTSAAALIVEKDIEMHRGRFRESVMNVNPLVGQSGMFREKGCHMPVLAHSENADAERRTSDPRTRRVRAHRHGRPPDVGVLVRTGHGMNVRDWNPDHVQQDRMPWCRWLFVTHRQETPSDHHHMDRDQSIPASCARLARAPWPPVRR